MSEEFRRKKILTFNDRQSPLQELTLIIDMTTHIQLVDLKKSRISNIINWTIEKAVLVLCQLLEEFGEERTLKFSVLGFPTAE